MKEIETPWIPSLAPGSWGHVAAHRLRAMTAPEGERPLDLHQLLAEGVLVTDGAMGTLLEERGIPQGRAYDLANLTHPALVQSVHEEYIDAGARLIETNTMAPTAGPPAGRSGRRDQPGRRRIARRAAGDRALVAGAMGSYGRHLVPVGNHPRAFRAFMSRLRPPRRWH